ncbi:hypothetical protein JXB27_04455 [Candidatus Woesearchaeota archaeon]|nr:hypothetical protein [Candidatus Woesearchaeota archaeon]
MKKTNLEVRKVLDMFDKNKIKYCIARNYDFLMNDKIYEGKDTDVVVFSKDKNKINKIMGGLGFGVVPINPFSMHTGYAKYIPEDEKLLQFHFHLDGITGRHTKYLDAQQIISRSVRKSGFSVSSNEDLFLINLLHSVLDLSKMSEKYRKELSSSRNIVGNLYVRQTLLGLFSKKQTDALLNYVSNNNFSAIEKLMPNLKRRFENRRIFKIAKVLLCGSVWKIHRLFKLAPLVSLIGMDGTGKTTTVSYLKEAMDKNRIKYLVYYAGRGRNNILPIQFFGKVYKKAEEKHESSKVQSNHTKNKTKKTSLLKKTAYTIAAPVFAFDLFMRYWFKIFPARLKNQVVITDRYASDILLMANVPRWLKNFLYLFLPKPTSTIYLWNKPEVLHARKTAHPLDDLQRQEKIFAEIKNKVKYVTIKSEGIDKTTKEVAEKVFSSIFGGA